MIATALALLMAAPVAAHAIEPKCSDFVTGQPSWMTCELVPRKRLDQIVMQGRSGWAGQPVVDRVRIKLRGDVRSVAINRGMLAQLTVIGTKGPDRITLGSQAGTISKRFTSRIKLGKDNARDVFTFTNTTASHGPFNHAQRIVIQQFGKEDIIRLKNVNRVIRYKDIQGDGSIPGVPRLAIRVETLR